VGWLSVPKLKQPYEEELTKQGKKRPPGHSLWMYDVASGKFEWFGKTDAPGKGRCLGYVQYVDSKKMHLVSGLDGKEWWYDVAGGKISATPRKGEGPPPFPAYGSCYDPKRDRVYVYGSSKYNWPADEPIQPDNHFFYYDVKAGEWVKPRAKNTPSIPVAWGRFMMEYDTVNDRFLLLYANHKLPEKERFIHVYDPDANEFAKPIPVSPEDLPVGLCHSFYCPELNAFIIHSAPGDNYPGNMWAYRYKKAPRK
jgi:hypothetical protein